MGKSIGSDPQKQELKWELVVWRTKMQDRVQDRVQLKDSICFKWVQSKLVPKNLDLGHPTKVGLIYETNHVRLLQHACASHVWALSLEFLSAKNIHAQDTMHKETTTYSHRGGIWGVAYRTSLLPWCKAYQNHYQGAYWQGTRRYISPQICMSPYTWSFVILGIVCIPSYSAAPLQTALYQPDFMFGNFHVWPTSVAQCNPFWLVCSGVNNWNG
jgi:hypothetical protein